MYDYRRRKVFRIAACALIVFVLSGCSGLGEIGREMADERAAKRASLAGRDGFSIATGPKAIVNPNASTIDAMRAHPNLSSSLKAFESAEIIPNIPSPATLLLPTNAAFERMPSASAAALLNDRAMLQRVLSHHVLQQKIGKTQLLQQTQLMTLSGYPLTVSQGNAGPKLNGTTITEADIPYSGGFVQKIDRVLFPPPPNGMAAPVIDSSGVATFKGDYLTVVGSAEPNMRILLQIDGNRFGSALVSAEGTWLIANNIAPGDYELIAYMIKADNVPLATSEPVYLIVTE